MSRVKATILYIDDRWNGLINRKKMLEQNGYSVLDATSGRKGLKLLRSHPVDAVVLEDEMPGMSGGVVAAKIKHINSQIPIVLLCGDEGLPKRNLESVDSVVPKSESSKVLLCTLQNLLDAPPQPFFFRWLDHWRVRNQGAGQ